jgi:hypothetical protein
VDGSFRFGARTGSVVSDQSKDMIGVSSIRSKQGLFLTFFEAGFWAWPAGPGRWGLLALEFLGLPGGSAAWG